MAYERGVLKRYFDAAGKGRRQAGWRRSGANANLTNRSAVKTLRDTGRDLARNNGWARRAIGTIGKNTVGWGIQARSPNAGANAQWKAWANDAKQCDASGLLPFSGLQRLVIDTVVTSGEVLVVRDDTSNRGMKIKVLEPDYLDTLKVGDNIESGVEMDQRGRPVAYWLFDRHPGSDRAVATSRRHDARDVCHVFLVERPEQIRGVSWLAAAVLKLKDFDDYEDAVLMRQKIAACFAAFVTDIDGSGSTIGGEGGDDEIDSFEPGTIEYLPPGRDIKFADPPSMTDNDSFSANTLRAIAAALNVTYEDLTGDYSRVNFSSARMARLSHWADVHHWRWNMIVPMFCQRVWDWFCEERFGATVPVSWAPPPMPMIEPDREGLAYSRLIRNGVMTHDAVVIERGGDPDTHWDEYAAGLRKLDQRGIVLDSDPRKTSAAGLTQERVGGGKGGKPPAANATE